MVSPNSAWILQANPREWDVGRFLADVRRGRSSPETTWLAPTHAKEIAAGDRIYIWTTGDENSAGVVATGWVVEAADERPEDKSEYRMPGFEDKYGPPRTRMVIQIEAPLKFHLSRRVVRAVPALADLSILRRRPQGTVFPVMPDEQAALDELCRSRLATMT